MLRLAIERCVESISEASRHVPWDIKASGGSVAEWLISGTSCVMLNGPSARISCGRLATRHAITSRAEFEQMLARVQPEED